MWTPYTVDSVDNVNGMIFLKGEGCIKPHKNPNNIFPEPGEVIEVKTFQGRDAIVGMQVTGVRIRGEVLFEISDEDAERQQTAKRRANDAVLREAFAQSRYVERLAALPVWMQNRQIGLAEGLSDYDWRYGRLDLAVLETANMLLSHYKTREELANFTQMTPDAVLATFPNIDQQLTDRMMSSAVMTAAAYLEGVEFPHSTMCQILGCETVNCIAHRTPKEPA